MDTRGFTITALVVALLVVAAVVVVARRTTGRLRLRSLLVPGAVLVVAGMVSVVAAGGLARSSTTFSAMHVAYLVMGIAVPAAGVAVIVASIRRGATWPVWVVAIALLIPAPVTWYGTHVAPHRLRVERAEVALPPERAGSDPIRIGVVADLQTTRVTAYEQRAVTRLLALAPDVIVIPGDVFQGSDRQFEAQLGALRALLGRLHAPGGVYAVRGDVDTGHRLDRIVAGTDIQILDDVVETFRVGDRTVRIGGNPLLWAPPPAVAMRRALIASDPSDVRLLLSHRPDVVKLLPPSSGVDLTISGHTHGGQVVVPLYGPLVTASTVSRSVARGGLHEVQGNAIFVSSGVGLARLDAPQVRIFTRPAIGLVVLR
ncbi:metallophosphoesterase [Aquihabitans sp. McL0605]|uniref:metallophosphoesterase n=1 Tax=Aquihabitans sp. McL0605 TaxID=3415671 RepID=UPI003CEE94F2